MRARLSGENYKWVVLFTGAFGAASFAMLRMGLPALGPALRDEFDLTLTQVGLVFSTVAFGVCVALLPWGILTDRVGERPVMAGGLTAFAVAIGITGFSSSYSALLVGMFLAGAMGASATGASGRAVMGWFSRAERGTALGIRQMALPLGGAIGSLILPRLIGAGGLEAAFLTLSGVALTAALAALLLMRDAPAPQLTHAEYTPDVEQPTHDPRQWRLGAASGLLVVGQSALLGFIVLFLVDARGLSTGIAAAGLAALQLLGAVARILAGRRSDREGLRIPLLRRIAAADGVLLGACALLAGGPGALLYPILLTAGVIAMCWNGLAFTAAAEIAGRHRAGTAMGLQNTVVSVGSTLAPTGFGALVHAAGWSAAYGAAAVGPVVALALLAPLQRDEARRAADRATRVAAGAIARTSTSTATGASA
ncbi:putative MFS-type transporter [Baekduia alba]|uniref:MFS transporter n=1 Tax=Baekduia alba TaxID=2997333 RepID=UPI002341B230|nr:MFS transporter [Baekduia alba]WCB96835.1 putative MFS-type transporter [Baekduia alba]